MAGNWLTRVNAQVIERATGAPPTHLHQAEAAKVVSDRDKLAAAAARAQSGVPLVGVPGSVKPGRWLVDLDEQIAADVEPQPDEDIVDEDDDLDHDLGDEDEPDDQLHEAHNHSHEDDAEELTEAEQDLLDALAAGRPGGRMRGSVATARALVSYGLAEERPGPDGRPRFRLTEDGKALADPSAAPVPTTSTRHASAAPAPPAGSIAEQVVLAARRGGDPLNPLTRLTVAQLARVAADLGMPSVRGSGSEIRQSIAGFMAGAR